VSKKEQGAESRSKLERYLWLVRFGDRGLRLPAFSQNEHGVVAAEAEGEGTAVKAMAGCMG